MILAILIALFTALLGSMSAAEEPSIVPAPQPPTSAQSNAQRRPLTTQYVIRCQLLVQSADGSPRTLHSPTLVVMEDQEGHIAVQGERTFVTGLQTAKDNSVTPIVTPLREGTSGSVTVKTLEEDTAHVDASFTVATIREATESDKDIESGTTAQAPLLTTQGWRIVRTVQLGKTIDIHAPPTGEETMGPLVARLTVDRIGADEAAITPISAAEAKATESEQLVWNTYQVSDLLEPHAQSRVIEGLSEIDFLPIVDHVIQHAMVEWPDDAEIRTDVENGRLDIKQTQKSHERIGQLLRDKRHHVADVRKLLRR